MSSLTCLLFQFPHLYLLQDSFTQETSPLKCFCFLNRKQMPSRLSGALSPFRGWDVEARLCHQHRGSQAFCSVASVHATDEGPLCTGSRAVSRSHGLQRTTARPVPPTLREPSLESPLTILPWQHRLFPAYTARSSGLDPVPKLHPTSSIKSVLVS